MFRSVIDPNSPGVGVCGYSHCNAEFAGVTVAMFFQNCAIQINSNIRIRGRECLASLFLYESRILRWLQGGDTVDAIVRRLEEEYGQPCNVVRTDVLRFIEALVVSRLFYVSK